MGKQIYSNKFMLTETYKAVSSPFFFARVHSYFVKWAKLPINKECWLGMGQQTMLYIYGTHFVWRAILDLIMCENPIIQSAVKTKPFYGFGWNLRFK